MGISPIVFHANPLGGAYAIFIGALRNSASHSSSGTYVASTETRVEREVKRGLMEAGA